MVYEEKPDFTWLTSHVNHRLVTVIWTLSGFLLAAVSLFLPLATTNYGLPGCTGFSHVTVTFDYPRKEPDHCKSIFLTGIQTALQTCFVLESLEWKERIFNGKWEKEKKPYLPVAIAVVLFSRMAQYTTV